MLNNHKKNAGNTIIEVLIATVIVATILTALAATMTRSVHNSAEAEYRQIASRMGQDVIEVFRQDKNIYPWETFVPLVGDGTFCVPATFNTIKNTITQSVSVTNIQYCPVVNSTNMNFNRAITKEYFDSPSPAVKITVTVSWNAADATRKRTVTLEQLFYKAN